MHRLAALLLLTAAPALAQPLQLLAVAHPGIFDAPRSGATPTGLGMVVLDKLALASGLTLQVRLMPAARALQTADRTPDHCVTGVPRTPEHEPRFAWAGPLASGAVVLYGRADETRQVHGLDDLRHGATVVVLRLSQPAQLLREHGIAAQEVNDTQTGLRMLQAGRVDFWLANDVVAQPAIQRAGGRAPKALQVLGRIDAYLACHPALAPDTLERLQKGLEQLRRQGDLAVLGLH